MRARTVRAISRFGCALVAACIAPALPSRASADVSPPTAAPASTVVVPSATPRPKAPKPELQFGKTPVRNCPRFFIGLSLEAIDRCADALADANWGLSAVTQHDASYDTFAGAFEPHAPKRWLASDADGAPKFESETGFVVDKLDAADHVITEYQRGPVRVCEDLMLFNPHDFSVPDKSAYFTTKMSDQAGAGCVPGSRYGVIRPESIQQEEPTQYVAFVPGDPRARVAAWPKTDKERQAFEKRAVARGFHRLALASIPDRWGRTAGVRFEEAIPLGAPPSRYDLLEARLAKAAKHGVHVVDLAIDGDTLTVLWERRVPAKRL